MPVDHKARAQESWPILVDLAREGQTTITYAELAAKIGVHHRAATYFLSIIQDHCEQENLPPLQVQVVNKHTGKPGGGYRATGTNEEQFKSALERVRNYAWPREVKL